MEVRMDQSKKTRGGRSFRREHHMSCLPDGVLGGGHSDYQSRRLLPVEEEDFARRRESIQKSCVLHSACEKDYEAEGLVQPNGQASEVACLRLDPLLVRD